MPQAIGACFGPLIHEPDGLPWMYASVDSIPLALPGILLNDQLAVP